MRDSIGKKIYFGDWFPIGAPGGGGLSGDMLKWIILFPLYHEAGHKIIYAYFWRNIAKTKKNKAYFYSPRGHSEMIYSISCLPENRKWNYVCLRLEKGIWQTYFHLSKGTYQTE